MANWERVQIGDCDLYRGDCLEVLPYLANNGTDAIVTDPPAGIGFMGKEWDDFRRARNGADASRDDVFGRTSSKGPEYGRRGKRNPKGQTDRDAYRAVDPSRPGYAFQGGSDLPKDARSLFIHFLSTVMVECLRVLKPGGYALIWAIPRTSHWTATAIEDAGFEIRDRISHIFGSGFPKSKACLKPACEDWWLCRKPARKMTPLNIDDCRIPTNELGTKVDRRGRDDTTNWRFAGDHNGGGATSPLGRWPANVVLSVPEDEYELCSELTSEQKKEVLMWLHENT